MNLSAIAKGLIFASLSTSLVCVPNALAANRLFAILSECGPQADAQFVGNRSHGRIQLTSFSADGDAGFYIDGVEGKTINDVRSSVIYEPLAPGVSTFTLRVKVNRGGQTLVQRFSLGEDFNDNLPHIPAEAVNDGLVSVSANTSDLVGGKSKLLATDEIVKMSYIFSARKTGARRTQFVNFVFWATTRLPIGLEGARCALN